MGNSLERSPRSCARALACDVEELRERKTQVEDCDTPMPKMRLMMVLLMMPMMTGPVLIWRPQAPSRATSTFRRRRQRQRW